MPNDPRRGTPRRTACAEVRSRHQPCHLCGYPIDQTLDRQHHPMSSTVDELIPLAHGGSTTDPTNLAEAHRFCNSWRATRPLTPQLRTELRTELTRQGLITMPATTRTW